MYFVYIQIVIQKDSTIIHHFRDEKYKEKIGGAYAENDGTGYGRSALWHIESSGK